MGVSVKNANRTRDPTHSYVIIFMFSAILGTLIGY